MSTQATASAVRLYQVYLVAVVVFLLGNLFVRQAIEHALVPWGATLAIALVTVAPFVATAILFRKLLQQDLDELLQKVVLEGLAFAFVTVLPLVALYVNLRSAGVHVPRLDAPDLIIFPFGMVGAGMLISWRRYQ